VCVCNARSSEFCLASKNFLKGLRMRMKYLYHLQATWVTVCFKLILASVISIGDFRTAESVPDARAYEEIQGYRFSH